MPELYQELIKLAESEMYPFHMPGHKRNIESTPMKGAFRCDITEIDGFDNLHDALGIIKKAQERANRLYGAKETFFVVNGSTAGVLSAISAAVKEGGTILAARGSHRSFYHAAYLRHLNIKYLPYKINPEYNIPESYSKEEVKEYLTNEVDAVFITSPTYEGKCSDIEGIAGICHDKNIPLIVDAAHGAHLGFESDPVKGEYTALPKSAVQMGADLVIHSVHKTLPSMTQTALLHINGDLIDADKVRRFLRIYQSSSPSYVLMASIDLCMKEMEENGRRFVGNLLRYRNRIREKTINCRYIEIPGKEDIQDASKVLICVKNAQMTGQQLYDILREEYNLQMEMASEKFALAIITGWDTEKGIQRLIDAVCDIDRRIADNEGVVSGENANTLELEEAIFPLPHVNMPIYEAFDDDREEVLLKEASGRTSADFVNLYPPGVPLIVPGEVFNSKIIEDINHYIDIGLNIQGTTDGRKIICVKQK